MRDEWLIALRNWPASNGSVQGMGPLGSRATDCARDDRDIALLMAPPDGNHNWGVGNFVECFDDWKAELRDAVDLGGESRHA
jgi:hypothetical protein